jgi:hypothetical protein
MTIGDQVKIYNTCWNSKNKEAKKKDELVQREKKTFRPLSIIN